MTFVMYWKMMSAAFPLSRQLSVNFYYSKRNKRQLNFNFFKCKNLKLLKTILGLRKLSFRNNRKIVYFFPNAAVFNVEYLRNEFNRYTIYTNINLIGAAVYKKSVNCSDALFYIGVCWVVEFILFIIVEKTRSLNF